MRRSAATRWVAVLAALVALVAPAGCRDATADDGAASGEASGPPGPNVVVVVTDDQTWSMMAALPRTAATLGREGTTFTRASVAMPLCCPNRASLLTGQYPHSHGVRDNVAPAGGFASLPWDRTLATTLQEAGYRTSHVGRTLNDYTVDTRPLVPPGWDDWYVPLEDETRSFLGRGATFVANGELVATSPFTHTDDAIAQTALAIVDEAVQGDVPFYLEVGTVAPHTARPAPDAAAVLPVPADRHPVQEVPGPPPGTPEDGKPAWVGENAGAPAEGIASYRDRAFASLRAVDEMVASLVGRLDRAGVLDRTLVVFTSDNGILLGEHGLAFQKVTPYEPSVRVPLLVRGPGFPADSSDLPVSLVDVAPTVLRTVGLDVPDWMEGVPLQESLADPDRAATRALLVESPPDERPAPPFVQVRSGDLVLTRYDTGEAELTDLSTDPLQAVDREDDPSYAADLAALDDLLARLRTCTGRSCVVHDTEVRP